MAPVTSRDRRIVLASGSPRRRELVRQLGFEPIVRISEVEERREAGESPAHYTRRLALDKARAVAAACEANPGDEELPEWILSADTIVSTGAEILEKPADAADARSMLRRLAGEVDAESEGEGEGAKARWHTVITAFCWMSRIRGVHEVCDVHTEVAFRPLSDAMIARYVATGEPMDKAGAYGIQGLGSALVRELRGSYFAVVGLPICEVVEVLQSLGGLEEFPFT